MNLHSNSIWHERKNCTILPNNRGNLSVIYSQIGSQMIFGKKPLVRLEKVDHGNLLEIRDTS